MKFCVLETRQTFGHAKYLALDISSVVVRTIYNSLVTVLRVAQHHLLALL